MCTSQKEKLFLCLKEKLQKVLLNLKENPKKVLMYLKEKRFKKLLSLKEKTLKFTPIAKIELLCWHSSIHHDYHRFDLFSLSSTVVGIYICMQQWINLKDSFYELNKYLWIHVSIILCIFCLSVNNHNVILVPHICIYDQNSSIEPDPKILY